MKTPHSQITLLRAIANSERESGNDVIASDLDSAADTIETLDRALRIAWEKPTGVYLGVPVSEVIGRALRGLAPEKPTKPTK